MTCYFTSFSIVFQSYLDDERLRMKDSVQCNPVYDLEDFAPRRGSNSGLLDQQASA